MQSLRAGVIGCGGRGNGHALAYSLSDDVQRVACADVHGAAAERTAERYGFNRTYTDYREMLAREELDVVSMCLWPALHEKAVLACVDAPHPPRLINAEKPMAPTYGACVRMHEACTAAGIALTFSHQRRFGPRWRVPKDLLDSGMIGDLERMEMNCSNLFDWGTHWFDMMLFYNGDLDPDWVMGQVDCAAEALVFGATVETAGLAYVKWPNGVTGLLTTGAGTAAPVSIRICGTEGRIDISNRGVRMLREGQPWETVDLPRMDAPGGETTQHILDAIDCLREGRRSILCSENALRATQLIFATYESSRRRRRVVLPLKSGDSPLLAMLDSGQLVVPDWPAFLTEEEEDEGFELLFNGEDLAGFAALPEDAWHVAGGLLRGRKPGALLRSEERWADIEVSFEIRLRESRGAAELLLRTNETGTDEAALRIPLKDDRHEPPSPTSTGSVNGILAPSAGARMGGSGWGWVSLRLEGNRLGLSINDRDVQAIDTASDGRFEEPPSSGFIAIRALHGGVDLRNVLVRRLGSDAGPD